jgi:hypothetical protein
MTEYLTVDDMVARYKGKIKKGTLANWRSGRKGPSYVKLEGRIMYPLNLVETWEKAGLKDLAEAEAV